MTNQWKVGDAVTVTKPIYEPPDEFSPGGFLANPGEKLIVREVRDKGQWAISVSHEGRTDGLTFSVSAEELENYV